MERIYILLCVCCLISAGLAQPVGPILAYQDSLGQYSFGYSAPGSARSEIRTLNGETRGAYSYIDDSGVLQSAQYTADGENGYRVVVTNFPQTSLPIQGTQEVVAARNIDTQVPETTEGERKIGENNVFLQGLRSSKEKIDEVDEKEQLKTKDEGNIQTKSEKMESDETLKMESEARAENVNLENEKPKISSNEQVFQTLKESKIPVLRISKENLAIEPRSSQEPMKIPDSIVTPGDSKELPKSKEELSKSEEQGTIAPVHILPAYPSILRYAPVPTIHYVVYNSP